LEEGIFAHAQQNALNNQYVAVSETILEERETDSLYSQAFRIVGTPEMSENPLQGTPWDLLQ